MNARIRLACALVALGLAVPAQAAPGDPQVPIEAYYQFLLAEFAAQRGDTEAAILIYTRVARQLKDPLVARRAVETAIRARSLGQARDAAALLLELDPESSLAREIIASLLANEGGLDKATETLAGMAGRSTDRGAFLMQLSHLFAKYPDKAAVLEATRSIASRYAELPESHYATGVAALLANRNELALEEARAALQARAGWQPAAILQAQVLRRTAPDQVISFYQAFVAQHPQSREVRQQLGRELAGERRTAEAREQFREVEKAAPDEPQAAYAIGLLSLQLEDFADAEAAFKRALDRGYRDSGAVYLSLGAAAEGQKRFDDAIAWYRKVDSADWVRAQLKIATLVARQQGLAAGREYLQKIEPRSTEDQIQMVQVEAQLLRDAKAWRETYDLLDRAVRDNPDSYELIYDRAMAAERLDKLDIAEADLRRVIRMKPDYAHAYNALGYTLADKTNRLEEARGLIEQAIKLAPEDPFILDSLGWVHYRLGNLELAVKHLQVAYSQRADPEIAAHLGEVLWKVGQRDEAQKIWRAALIDNPDHESLLAVMQKFKP